LLSHLPAACVTVTFITTVVLVLYISPPPIYITTLNHYRAYLLPGFWCYCFCCSLPLLITVTALPLPVYLPPRYGLFVTTYLHRWLRCSTDFVCTFVLFCVTAVPVLPRVAHPLPAYLHCSSATFTVSRFRSFVRTLITVLYHLSVYLFIPFTFCCLPPVRSDYHTAPAAVYRY